MAGIDFSKLGAPNNGSGNNGGSNDREKANFWMNVGYSTTVQTGEGKDIVEETRFIALPGGIPLDSLKHVPTNSSNEVYAAQQAARNALYDQVMSIAQSLAPGEEKLIKLSVQVRRVNDERPTIAAEANPFVQQAPSLV